MIRLNNYGLVLAKTPEKASEKAKLYVGQCLIKPTNKNYIFIP
jgi:hypothetical protein